MNEHYVEAVRTDNSALRVSGSTRVALIVIALAVAGCSNDPVETGGTTDPTVSTSSVADTLDFDPADAVPRDAGPTDTGVTIDVPDAMAIAGDEAGVWVTTDGFGADSSVRRLDPADNSTVSTLAVGDGPLRVTIGAGSVWVASKSSGEGSLSRIDPLTNTVTATADTGGDPLGIIVDAGAVWVANYVGNSVARIDPGTMAVLTTIPVGESPADLAAGAGSIWVTNSDNPTVSRIDVATNTVTATIDVASDLPKTGLLPNLPGWPAFIDGSVWVTVGNESGAILRRIDVATNTVDPAHDHTLEDDAFGVAVFDDALWIATRAGVVTFDPTTETFEDVVTAPVIGRGPGLAVTSDSVWLSFPTGVRRFPRSD